jgi:hypothetical protein
MAGAIKTKGGVSEREAAKSALQKAKAIKERGKIGKGLKHHPLNPMRIIADTKETNLPLGPYESNLEKVKKKYKDKFPELVEKYKSGGRAGFKMGSKCKLAMKGKGRAYGKNS